MNILVLHPPIVAQSSNIARQLERGNEQIFINFVETSVLQSVATIMKLVYVVGMITTWAS